MVDVSEKDIERRILVQCTGGDVRLWKNENGMGYMGKVTRHGSGVVISPARAVRYGLCPDSSDLIGFKSVEITPEMVGTRVAVFTALEVKSETGRASDGQKRFLDMVEEFGGITGIVRSVDDAKERLDGFRTATEG